MLSFLIYSFVVATSGTEALHSEKMSEDAIKGSLSKPFVLKRKVI
jgi:hypothetical protein